mgnify:CR=1 FL=1
MTGVGAPVASPTRGRALADAAERLASAGVESPRRDARRLLAAALDVDVAELLAAGAEPLDADAAQSFARMVEQRARRMPVSRILGMREFWSLPIGLAPAALDPRPDSETLVAAVCQRVAAPGVPRRVLDLGTGSGCLLLALLTELPGATGIGVDRDPAAAATAAANARALNLAGRAAFVVGDWAHALTGPFDVVVSNPPYLRTAEIAAAAPEVAAWDPRDALDGGPDGLAAYRALLPGLEKQVAPDGLIVLEVGAGRSDAVAALVADHGLTVSDRARDLTGAVRCVIATGARPTGGQVRQNGVGCAADPD